MTSAIPNIQNLTLDNNFSNSSFKNISKEDISGTGYIPSVFELKNDQLLKVMDALDKSGLIPENLIESETKFFYENLGIDDTYFSNESIDNIVSNILSIYSAKIDSKINNNTSIHFKKISIDKHHAVYFETGNSNSFEKEIDDEFLDIQNSYYRVESFNSILPSNEKIKCHFVYKCDYSLKNNKSNNEFDLISDKTFSNISTNHTKSLYSEVLSDLSKTEGIVIKHYTVSETGELRIIIGYKKGSSHRYNSALSTLVDYYGVNLKKKYVENFSNDFTIISMYLDNINKEKFEPGLTTLQLTKDASLLYCIPDNKFYDKFESGIWSIQECIYAHCGVIFATHFLNRLGPEFQSLKDILLDSKNVNPKNIELISKIKDRFNSETFSESYIIETFNNNSKLIQQLFKNFVDTHYVSSSIVKTLSYQKYSKINGIENDEQFEKSLNDISNDGYQTVLKVLYSFNKSILKTNFFITSKIALSFRLNSSTFLPKSEYSNTPFGMFFVVGSEFRGFHIRFRDVARGGIRIVLSRSNDAYLKNMRSMFDENYNLASTQQRKNKDIPEGGSKGVILINPGSAQLKQKECFTKYIDSLLDLLIVDPSKEKIVDLYNKPEMLFMGPDENTAGFVDWATLHAKKRGSPFNFPWKAFFTGKSPTIGGIPHDEYGMTTLSVRAFTEGVYSKLNINDWSKINKLQMGGGDGDLGSNEIKLSGNETYVGIVDGFGCIVDENGIDKNELLRLANNRFGNNKFDISKLSSKGYAIMVDDKDIKLPNGKIINSGIQFRNNFHLKLQEIYPPNFINLWTPCGGRPNSIDVTTVHSLINEKTGKSIIPIIIEGANLFITQAAKYILEDAGAIVFKDASANKGGVTSSSMEVLAALSFDDAEFEKNMCMDSNTKILPEFYKNYVKEVQSIIIKNAQNEFNMLWKLKDETNKSFADLSDELSVAINKLADELSSSKELWEDDIDFRTIVLEDALPSLLLKEIGLENILKRVPEAYLKAIFATKLASEFVYTRGIDPNPAKFLEFVSSLKRRV
ncbi:NAD-dependent glutamate dehydrogenase [Pichia californica]|uniref:NAD-specific glutamate dehydrogenase n=1 Tax=Pichia californica TaxID=460514 RepID=A0A9P6WJ61_9ASCO|nr:NAD-dependent glutamate dehydrogenase [[Candida] californica]KAG0688125.1 NAD-dependent glutamate dehydrogenase [[Candida] californica]